MAVMRPGTPPGLTPFWGGCAIVDGMPKGGARTRSGPPPDPNALRRDRKSDRAGWLILPVEGRLGAPLVWPLTEPTSRELEVWGAEWRRPQAVEWDRAGQEAEVALYVRTFVAAESPQATAALRTLVRQQMDSLGITAPGLARLRWRIGLPPGSADAPETPAAPRRTDSARRRVANLKVVGGSGGA